VHAARGGRIRWAYIKNNDGAWVGFTEYRGAEYTLNPETDTSAKLLPIARDHCAGVTAERLFDAADFRHGSSLDELAVSQWMAAQAAFIDAVDAEGYWEKNVSDHVCKTLDKHRDVHADIAAHLMKHKQIKGAPLAEYILRIRAV
jgi:hypothetical protein